MGDFMQYGYGNLPVYSGTRYQRGGGLLDSLAHIAKPLAKKLLFTAVKKVPTVLGSIISRKQTPKAAVLQGLKSAGMETLKAAVAAQRPSRKRKAPPKRKTAPAKKRKTSAKKRSGKKDIFAYNRT